jgi:menaquinone-dependent protoporphyrinogen oxidase
MTGPVLVTYASKYGSTREVAEAIAGTLRDHLLRVVVQPSDEVEDLGEYSGVVLGGGIYMGRWHPDARRFIKHFEDDLRGVPVALFALGPTDDDPEHRAGSEKQFASMLEKVPLEPVATALFGGAIDPRKLSFPFNHMPAADVRDWDAIRAWAADVADVFLSVPALA